MAEGGRVEDGVGRPQRRLRAVARDAEPGGAGGQSAGRLRRARLPVRGWQRPGHRPRRRALRGAVYADGRHRRARRGARPGQLARAGGVVPGDLT